MIAFIITVLISIMLVNFAKYIGQSIFSPVCLITLLWTMLTCLSIIGTLSLFSWQYEGIIFLYIALFAFMIFYCIGTHFYFKKSSHSNTDLKLCFADKLSTFSWIFLTLLVGLALLKWIYEVSINGFDISDFMSLDSLAAMNNYLAVERYSGDGIVNPFVQILSIAVYTAPLCGGFAYHFRVTQIQRIISIGSIMPAFLVTLTQNTKNSLVGSCLLFFTGIILGYYCKHHYWPKMDFKKIYLFIFFIFLFLIVMIFSMMLRIGDISTSTLLIVMEKMIIYAFGNVQSFDIWFSNYSAYEETTYGMMTFLGIADWLGIAERIQGVYVALPGTSSNVFTAFRGLITDFGILGSIIYISLSGFILGISVNSIRHSINPYISIFLAGQIIFFMLYGFLISPWTYRGFILSMPLFMLYLWIAFFYDIGEYSSLKNIRKRD